MVKHLGPNKSTCVACSSAAGLTRRGLLGLSAGAVGPLFCQLFKITAVGAV